MPISIHFASPQDANKIWQFIHKLAAYLDEADTVETTAKMISAYMKSKNPPFECLIAEDKGKAIGFALFYPVFSTWTGSWLYLEDFYVQERYRGKGIGKEFFKHLAQIAHQRGYVGIRWTVGSSNKPALHFYQSLGAEPLKDEVIWRLSHKALRALLE